MKQAWLFGIVGLMVILAGCAQQQDKMMAPEEHMEKEAMEGEWSEEEMAAMEKEGMHDMTMEEGSMEKEAAEMGMTVEEHKQMLESMEGIEKGLIAGDISKYYDWDRAMFDQAVSEGKTIYLEFSADWCGVCQKQEPHLKAAFAELDDPNVVGFKIHYKDDQTTPEMEDLAKQYQIAYQHTKVILKAGQVVKKSPEAWEATQFLEEMRKLA